MWLLIKAGYKNDKRIEKGFEWLLSMRQEDCGWTIPFRTYGIKLKEALKDNKPALPDRSKPFSHLVTSWCSGPSQRILNIENLKKQKRQEYYSLVDFSRPVNTLTERIKNIGKEFLTPSGSLILLVPLIHYHILGFEAVNPHMQYALDFLRSRQNDDGLFDLKIVRGSDKALKYWICLAICRLFKRYGK